MHYQPPPKLCLCFYDVSLVCRQRSRRVCRHAKRLLKYGFDLGPQFSPDSNLPPDDGDSMPASVRRNAPSNVVLNIADLRNSMLETALDNDNASPKSADAAALPRLQPLSPQQQQALFLSDHPQADVLGSYQAFHHSGQASAPDVSSGSRTTQESQAPPHNDDRQHQARFAAAASFADNHTRDAVMANDLTDATTAVGDAEGVDPQQESTVCQYGRNFSAVRGRQSRPGLASVRFAEDLHDP